jgi:kynureninase
VVTVPPVDPRTAAEAVARTEFYVEGLSMGLEHEEADEYASEMAQSAYGRHRVASYAASLAWADLKAQARALLPSWLGGTR